MLAMARVCGYLVHQVYWPDYWKTSTTKMVEHQKSSKLRWNAPIQLPGQLRLHGWRNFRDNFAIFNGRYFASLFFFWFFFFSWKTRRIGGVKMSYNKVEGVESNSNFFFLFLFHSNLCSTIHCLLRSNFSIHTITTLITTHYSPFRDSHTYTSSHNFPSLHTNLLFPTSTALPIPVINNEYPHNPLPPPKEKQQQQQHLQHRDPNTRLKK